jgi:hypothetical protein
MRRILQAFFVGAVALSFVHCVRTIALGNALPITGTFSNFQFSEQHRGLEGVEVRIVVADNGYEATVQFAAGEASLLTLVPVRFEFEEVVVGQKIEVGEREESKLIFELPNGSPRPGKFAGAVTRTHLEGTFSFATGEVLNVNLPRGRSWWDR